MDKLYLFNKFVTIILFSLFSWQLFSASSKYSLLNTFISSKIIDGSTIMFPSITICKKHSNGLHENDTALSVGQKVFLLYERFWKKNEVIFFFSHNKMFNMTFPCNTWGGTDGGKPCSFPFIESYNNEINQTYNFKRHHSCFKGVNYCYTRFVCMFKSEKIIH